jgi:hypothetical protein
MYWDTKGKISNSINRFLHEPPLVYPIIILIIIFCNLKIFILWGKFPINISPYCIIELKQE